MKILHIASADLWAGAEVQLYNLLSALKDKEGVVVAAALLNDGELARRLRAAQIEVHLFPEGTLGGPRILRGLRALLRTWRPDIVHTHRQKENVLGSFANLLALRAPCVRTAHGAQETAACSLPQRAIAALDGWCGRHLQQRTIAVTRELAAKLAAHEPRARIDVIENGIDTAAAAAAAAASTPDLFEPGWTHVGIAGRLVRVKRVDLFLDTAALLCRQPRGALPPYRFHIFGDGPLRARLTEQAQALGIADRVAFHGHRHDIAACLKGLDVLVMCSDHEGMPMSLLEAMSIGTTIVGHSVGGIDQLLDNGSNGWPVTEHCAPGYARVVAAAMADPQARSQRSRAASEIVRLHYSASACASRHLSLYLELVGQPKTFNAKGRSLR